MNYRRFPFIRTYCVGILAICFQSIVGLSTLAQELSFARDVQPILSDNCFYCHGPDKNRRQADLRLDQQQEAHEAAIQPGDPDESLLVERIMSDDPDVIMPPPDSEKRLTPEQIETLKRWVEGGANYDEHWAFTPIVRPETENSSIHPIDQLVARGLERRKLIPMPRAEKATLIRRATLDLTGLPPTIEDVEEFLKDDSVDAFGEVIHRLLQSPRYGERMAWDWLDAARYADSNGYQGDNDRTMWPWRDWVIKAFNDNMRWDQFSMQQLAGDLMKEANDEKILATAFLRNHMINGEGGRIPEENRIEYVMDMSETVSTIWLGLTMNCCRCHDHKFDPISQKEYYSLFAFFNQTEVTGGGGNPQTKPILEVSPPEGKDRLAAAKKAHGKICEHIENTERDLFPHAEGKKPSDSERAVGLPPLVIDTLGLAAWDRKADRLDPMIEHFKSIEEDYAELLRQSKVTRANLTKAQKVIVQVMVMADQERRRKTFVLTRGLYNKPVDTVPAATPAAIAGLESPNKNESSKETTKELNRLDLAHWIVDKKNPLMARVTVNRFWQSLFGIGLVKTVEDFGVQGEYPPQRELLDWLAAEFVSSGWDVKHLLRTIMTSDVYQRSSAMTDQFSFERDPLNRYFARGPSFRMPSWMIRDQALAASGLIAKKMGGPAVKSYQPAGVWAEATFGKKKYQHDSGDAVYRRSVYLFWRRIIGPTVFFDNAKRQVCEVKMLRTNTPLHALATLNDVTYVEAARAMAERVMHAETKHEERLTMAFRLVVARKPTAQDLSVLKTTYRAASDHYQDNEESALEFLSHGVSQRDEELSSSEHAAMAATCLNILNLSEALTKE